MKLKPETKKYSSLVSGLSAQLFTFDIWTVIALSVVEVWSGLGNKATWFGLGKDPSLG